MEKGTRGIWIDPERRAFFGTRFDEAIFDHVDGAGYHFTIKGRAEVFDKETSDKFFRPVEDWRNFEPMSFECKPGAKLRFHFANGYPSELGNTIGVLEPGSVYTLKKHKVGRFTSMLTLEEVEGNWNTVHFEEV